jgi:hypothetical protein
MLLVIYYKRNGLYRVVITGVRGKIIAVPASWEVGGGFA